MPRKSFIFNVKQKKQVLVLTDTLAKPNCIEEQSENNLLRFNV